MQNPKLNRMCSSLRREVGRNLHVSEGGRPKKQAKMKWPDEQRRLNGLFPPMLLSKKNQTVSKEVQTTFFLSKMAVGREGKAKEASYAFWAGLRGREVLIFCSSPTRPRFCTRVNTINSVGYWHLYKTVANSNGPLLFVYPFCIDVLLLCINSVNIFKWCHPTPPPG